MAQTVKELEEEMEEIRMLMKIWSNFYKILTKTFYDKNVNVKELDPEFQQIKQVIASHHSHFMKVIKKDYHIGQSILTTVKRTITLDGFNNLSPLEVRKTLIEWHDANILLNETLGALECDRDKFLRGRKTIIPKDSKAKSAAEFFKSKAFKNLVGLIIVVLLIGLFFIYFEVIHATSIWQSYFKWLDPYLQSAGFPVPPDTTGAN